MIDLRDTFIRVNTREECEKLFEIARNQGFKWIMGKELKVCENQNFPDVICFSNDKIACCVRHKVYITSEILDEYQSEEKEMTAREFIDSMIKCADECDKRGSCLECPLYHFIEKSEGFGGLCRVKNWKGMEEKLIELVKMAEMTEEKATELLQKCVDNGSCKTPEEQEAIKLAIKKLRGE